LYPVGQYNVLFRVYRVRHADKKEFQTGLHSAGSETAFSG